MGLGSGSNQKINYKNWHNEQILSCLTIRLIYRYMEIDLFFVNGDKWIHQFWKSP